jgi:aminopeptidase N
MMKKWTGMTGYPVILVDLMNGRIILSQSRFYKRGPSDASDPSDPSDQWIVPIDIHIDSSKCSIILDKSTSTYPVDADLILVNPDRMGFFRVGYLHQPNIEKIQVRYWANILDDSFSLSLSGYQSFNQVFEMLNTMQPNKMNHCIWNTITIYLNQIYRYLYHYKDLQQYYLNRIMIPILKPLECILMRIGWNERQDDSFDCIELRKLIVSELAFVKNKTIINEVLNRFRDNNWFGMKSILPIVGKYGNASDFKKLLKLLYHSDKNPGITDYLLMALGSTTDSTLIKLSLKLCFHDIIKNQHLISYIRYLSINEATTDKIWDLVTSNWNHFIKKYPPGSSNVSNLVRAMGSGFMTEKQLNQYKDFFKTNQIDGTQMSINQTIERIENRIRTIGRILMDGTFSR